MKRLYDDELCAYLRREILRCAERVFDESNCSTREEKRDTENALSNEILGRALPVLSNDVVMRILELVPSYTRIKEAYPRGDIVGWPPHTIIKPSYRLLDVIDAAYARDVTTQTVNFNKVDLHVTVQSDIREDGQDSLLTLAQYVIRWKRLSIHMQRPMQQRYHLLADKSCLPYLEEIYLYRITVNVLYKHGARLSWTSPI